MPHIGPWEEFRLLRALDALEERKNSGEVQTIEEEGKGLRSSSYHFYGALLQSEKSKTWCQKLSRGQLSCSVARMTGVGDVFFSLSPFHEEGANTAAHVYSGDKANQIFSSASSNGPSVMRVDQKLHSSENPLSHHSFHLMPTKVITSSNNLPSRFCHVRGRTTSEKDREHFSQDCSNQLLEYLRGHLQNRPPLSGLPKHREGIHRIEGRNSGKGLPFYCLKESRIASTMATEFQRLGRLASVRAARSSGFPDVSSLKLPPNSLDWPMDGMVGNVPSEIEIANRMQYQAYLQQQQQLSHSQKEKTIGAQLIKMTEDVENSQDDEKKKIITEWKGSFIPFECSSPRPSKVPSIPSSPLVLSRNTLRPTTDCISSAITPTSSGTSISSPGTGKRILSIPAEELELSDDEADGLLKDNIEKLLDWAQQLDPSTI